ncbi:acyl-coenzyme A thioesterase THEM4-like [Anomaloglossus baeobatrachus]|uniref:acyl-coenzyme A thioesterase THEM4-like n=1 Tax=Anomaloglossus baeobatrachus TaxID=238106 RepID=UPI003F4F6B84
MAPAEGTDRMTGGSREGDRGSCRQSSLLRIMLPLRSFLVRGGGALGHLILRSHTGSAPQRWFSVSGSSYTKRDYSLPNEAWSQTTRELYRKYEALSRGGAWRRIPSYNSTVHHMADFAPVGSRVTRVFTRNLDQDGAGFEYSMFCNTEERRMVCIFQPGPFLEGPPGFTHGGCIATILDSTLGAGAVYMHGPVMTANLNINFRNPIPLGCTVIVDSHVEKEEGRKVYTRGQIRSHDDQILHTEATGLFIKLDLCDVTFRIN